MMLDKYTMKRLPRPELWIRKATFKQIARQRTAIFSMVKPFVPASVIFPGSKEDLEYLQGILSGFDADDTIMLCALLNQIINKPHEAHSLKQIEAVGGNLTKSEQRKIEAFATEHGGMENIYIIARPQLLYTIYLACQYCGNYDEFSYFSLKNRRTFLQALMASGKLVCDEIGLNRPLDQSRHIEREDLAGPVRASQDLVSHEPDIMRSIARGTELFLNCMKHVKPQFASSFQEKTNISLEQYFACLISLQASYEASSENRFIFQYNQMGKNIKDKITYNRFLALESCTIEYLRKYFAQYASEDSKVNPIFFKAFRERPIYRAADNRATIIDPIFLYQKTSVGPLFHLLGPDEGKNNEWFSAFGNAYELYADSILRRMFESPSELVKRLLIKENIIDYRGEALECDACLNDAHTLVLFEAKAVMLRDQTAISDNPKDFVRILEKKYGLSIDAEGKSTEKGVYQLAKLINAIIFQANNGNSIYANAKTIFPILLVHDVALNSPITSEILQGHFLSALGVESRSGFEFCEVGSIRVAPIIIMTIDDLEALEYSIANFSLMDLLNDYSLHSSTKPLSLRNYIHYSKYKSQMRLNTGMLERAEQHLMKAKEYLFYN